MVLVTHFLKMAQYLETFPSVKSIAFHLDDHTVATRHISEGTESNSHYGIESLQRLEFPDKVISMAKEMLTKVFFGRPSCDLRHWRLDRL